MGGGGLPWWLCSQEGQAWPLLAYRGIGLLSARTPWVLLGGRRSHFTSLLLPLWKPLSTPTLRPEEPFWLSASTTDICQKLLGLPTHSVLHTERLRLSTRSTGSSLGGRAQICLRISQQAEVLCRAVFLQLNPGTFHRGILRGGGLRPGVIWKEARPGQGWAGHSWCLWGGCVACLGSAQGQECGAGCLESWQAF